MIGVQVKQVHPGVSAAARDSVGASESSQLSGHLDGNYQSTALASAVHKISLAISCKVAGVFCAAVDAACIFKSVQRTP